MMLWDDVLGLSHRLLAGWLEEQQTHVMRIKYIWHKLQLGKKKRKAGNEKGSQMDSDLLTRA